MKLAPFVLAAGLALAPALSLADGPSQPPAAPAVAAKGTAVLGSSADAAWPLAQAVYAESALRPASLDEARARVLAGDAPAEGAAADVKELAELRAGVHGDDAASRQLLATIANRVHVASILVLVLGEGDAPPSAKLFLADAGRFDAAVYPPDDGSGQIRSWSGAVRSLVRASGASAPPPTVSNVSPPAATTPAPAAATAPSNGKDETKPASASSKPFYLSPWFWGAIGAAAFGAVAVVLATRDTSGGQIHLQMQVPK